MTAPLAHTGHWLVDALYVAPVVAVVVWISVRSLRDRRREAREPARARAPAGPEPDPRE